MKTRKGSIVMIHGDQPGWCIGEVKGFGIAPPYQTITLDILDTQNETELKEGEFGITETGKDGTVTMIEY